MNTIMKIGKYASITIAVLFVIGSCTASSIEKDYSAKRVQSQLSPTALELDAAYELCMATTPKSKREVVCD